MRIAVVHLGFFYAGGGERLVLEEVRGLRALGHEVECLAPIVDTRECFPELMAEVSVRSFLPNPPPWLPGRVAAWVLLSCLLAPLLALRLRRFDVVLAANQPAPWLAWVAWKLFGVPYVAYLAQPTRVLHPRRVDLEARRPNLDYRLFELVGKVARPVVGWAERVSVTGASSVLVNGTYMASILQELYGRPMISCPAGGHPVNREDVERVRAFRGRVRVNGLEIMKPYVLLTNRHYPQKRFEVAVRALPTLPGAQLVITGAPTAYTETVRATAEELGVGDRLILTGLVSDADLDRLYGEAAVYVYPAPEEDYGMGIVEAMAHGVPVVAWRAAGPTSTVVDGETGFLAEPGDESDFARGIAHLLEDRSLAHRMGRAGWRRVSDGLGYGSHCEQIEDQLRRAMTGMVKRAAGWRSSPAFRLAVQAGLGAAMLWLWSRTVPLAEVWQHARPQSWLPIAAIFPLLLASGLMRTWRLTRLMRPIAKVPVVDAFWINGGGGLVNYLIPIRAGEVAKIWWLNRRHGALAGAAVATVVVDRTFDLGAVVVFLALAAVGSLALGHGGVSLVGVLGAAGAASGLLAMVLATAALGPRVAHSPRLRRRLSERTATNLEQQAFSFRAGLASIRRPVSLILLAVVSLLALAADSTAFTLMFVALGIKVGFAVAFAAYAVLVLSFALPAAPGYVGTLELAGSIVIRAGIGLSAPAAAGAIVLWHVTNAIWVLGTGLVALTQLLGDRHLPVAPIVAIPVDRTTVGAGQEIGSEASAGGTA